MVGSIAGFLGSATSALSTFVRVGLAAAGIAALISAPFTGGASLITYGAIVGTAGAVAMSTAQGGGGTGGATGGTVPGFATGGTIATQQAVVHPGELIVTGGQGSEVISAQKFDELIMAVKNQSAAPQEISVYIGQEKIDQLVVKGINSPAGRQASNPFGNG